MNVQLVAVFKGNEKNFNFKKNERGLVHLEDLRNAAIEVSKGDKLALVDFYKIVGGHRERFVTTTANTEILCI